MTKEEIEKLAEAQWEWCHGCDQNDKAFWINGFATGYLNARIDNIDDRIEKAQNKISDLLINGDNCEYSGLPSVKSYEEDKTFKTKNKWTKII
jgi:hypothetical protein